MRRTLRWMSIPIALAAITTLTLALAQPPANNPPQDQQQGAGRGGRGGDRFGAQMMARMGALQPPAIVATDKFLFIVRGNTVFKLDINSLEILKQCELPMPEGMPGGQGPQPGGGAQPPAPPAGQ